MKDEKIKISKIDAAERQINSAIKMFFANEDPISIHTVVCAGLQIVEDLAKKLNKQTSYSAMLSLVKSERQKEAYNILRRPQNFLKHAENDPDDILEYNPKLVEHYLALACIGYQELTTTSSNEISSFILWFTFVYPDVLNYGHIPGWEDKYKEYITKWGAPIGVDDKKLMLELIEKSKYLNL